MIYTPRHGFKWQWEEWVISKYGWTKSKARNTSRKKLVFIWYHPEIDWR